MAKTPTEQYISKLPQDMKERMFKILEILRKAAPKADETLKYGKPALSYKRVLIIFSEAKKHIGFYPTPKVIVAFSKELENYDTSKGTIRFPHDKPLPLTLIKKMALHRVKLYKEEDALWKEK